jgi:hypothetical protein
MSEQTNLDKNIFSFINIYIRPGIVRTPHQEAIICVHLWITALSRMILNYSNITLGSYKTADPEKPQQNPLIATIMDLVA